MESFLTLCGKLKEILTDVQLAATICISWLLLQLALACPSQFVELRAYCDENMYWLDFLGILCSARLVLALILHFKPHFRQWRLKRMVTKEIKRIFKTHGSEDYKLVLHLYHKPDSLLNPYDTLVTRLCSRGIIKPASGYRLQADGYYTGAFQLTYFARNYMERNYGERLK